MQCYYNVKSKGKKQNKKAHRAAGQSYTMSTKQKIIERRVYYNIRGKRCKHGILLFISNQRGCKKLYRR